MTPGHQGGLRRRVGGRTSMVGVWLLAVCLASACATGQPSGGVDRFVRRADPTVPDEAIFDVPGEVPRATPAPVILPGMGEIRARTASDLRSVERSDLALRLALSAVDVWETAASHRRAGDAYRRLQILDQAYSHYRQAVAIDKRDAASFDGLARTWRDWGLPEIALGDAYRAVSLAPRSAEAQNTLGTVLYALGDSGAAEARFERARVLDPTAAFARNNLCYLAYLRGDSERAGSECAEAVRLAPSMTAAHNNLALVHASVGRMDLAERSLGLVGNAANSRFNLGILLIARADYARAAVAFDAACRELPLSANACRLAAQARALAGATANPVGDRR
jgi:Tfp pilus assembly protein PilF